MFLLNSLSYVAVIWALSKMRIRERVLPRKAVMGLAGLREGFSYVVRFRTLGYLLVNLSLMGMLGGPYLTLLPVFAKNVLRGGPQTLGLLIGSVGVGAMAGALFLASRKGVRGLGRVIAAAMVVYSLGLIALSHSRLIPLSMGVLLFTGLGTMMLSSGTNTLVQALVDEDKRGRVMSVWAMSILGAHPIGSLWAGAVANKIGAPLTVYIGGILCLAATGLFILRLPHMRREARPILEKQGHA